MEYKVTPLLLWSLFLTIRAATHPSSSTISWADNEDDGYNSDDETNQWKSNSNNSPDEITKIIENYGSCPDKQEHSCLWYKVRLHQTGRLPNNLASSSTSFSPLVDGPLGRTCVGPSCLDAHLDDLERSDPHFYEYLQHRFYLLKGMRERNREFRLILERLLEPHPTLNHQMKYPFIEGTSTAAVATGLEALIQERRLHRLRIHRQICKAQLAQYIYDVQRLLYRLHRKNQSQQQAMDRWITTGYTQKEKLYKILLHAQRRDMQRLLQLRSLKLWYMKKIHLLDKLSKQRLTGMLKWLQSHELRFQQHLWDRLEQLQRSADDWTRHEKAYKEALLALGRQQRHILKGPCSTNHRLDLIRNILMKKVVVRQEQLAQEQKTFWKQIQRLGQQVTRRCFSKPIKLKKQRHVQVQIKTSPINKVQREIVKELGKCCSASQQASEPKEIKKIVSMKWTRHHFKCPKSKLVSKSKIRRVRRIKRTKRLIRKKMMLVDPQEAPPTTSSIF